jgi:hypothetical protein
MILLEKTCALNASKAKKGGKGQKKSMNEYN